MAIVSWEGGMVHPILQMMHQRPGAAGQLAGSHTASKQQSSASKPGPLTLSQDPAHWLPGRKMAGNKVPSKGQHLRKGHTHGHTHTPHSRRVGLSCSLSSSQPSVFNQFTPNGPYTLLKIYSYKLHCQSGLGLGVQRDHRKGWALILPLGVPPLRSDPPPSRGQDGWL